MFMNLFLVNSQFLNFNYMSKVLELLMDLSSSS